MKFNGDLSVIISVLILIQLFLMSGKSEDTKVKNRTGNDKLNSLIQSEEKADDNSYLLDNKDDEKVTFYNEIKRDVA